MLFKEDDRNNNKGFERGALKAVSNGEKPKLKLEIGHMFQSRSNSEGGHPDFSLSAFTLIYEL